ncbi:hypothetical protein D3C76_1497920 [compost metagenome]
MHRARQGQADNAGAANVLGLQVRSQRSGQLVELLPAPPLPLINDRQRLGLFAQPADDPFRQQFGDRWQCSLGVTLKHQATLLLTDKAQAGQGRIWRLSDACQQHYVLLEQ